MCVSFSHYTWIRIELETKKGTVVRALKIISKAYPISINDHVEMRRMVMPKRKGKRTRSSSCTRTQTHKGMKWNSTVGCLNTHFTPKLYIHGGVLLSPALERIAASFSDSSRPSISATMDLPHPNYRFFRHHSTMEHLVLLIKTSEELVGAMILME